MKHSFIARPPTARPRGRHRQDDECDGQQHRASPFTGLFGVDYNFLTIVRIFYVIMPYEKLSIVSWTGTRS